MASGVRERLLDAAEGLFRGAGFASVGIDAIIARAGVAKMSLYKHFKSKDALIAAVLARDGVRRRAAIEEGLERAGASPVDRLLSVFDVAAAEAARAGWRPALAVAAAVEFGDPRHPAREASDGQRRWLLEAVTGLAAEAGVDRPGSVSQSWLVLLDGAALAGADAFRDAKSVARMLLDQ